MILIAYDGSNDAAAAIAQAGKLFPQGEATVLVVWERFIDAMTRAGTTLGAVGVDFEGIDEATEKAAVDRAARGVQLAQAVGLTAQPHTVALDSTAADAILREAERLDPSAIVMGSRGLTGVKSVVLGSVSNAVIHHADRPVVVVPSPEAVKARKRRLAEEG